MLTFEAWLRSLQAKGYDRDWVRRNIPQLRGMHERGEELPPAPNPPSAKYDRYEDW